MATSGPEEQQSPFSFLESSETYVTLPRKTQKLASPIDYSLGRCIYEHANPVRLED